jgi:hypothetical protein
MRLWGRGRATRLLMRSCAGGDSLSLVLIAMIWSPIALGSSKAKALNTHTQALFSSPQKLKTF